MTASAQVEAVSPAFFTVPDYSETLGPEVADLSELAGFSPDPEQRMALDALFALGPDGKAAAFEFDVICARQNLKTGLFKQAVLGWLFITDQRLVVWSAHEFSTSQEAFRDLSELVESSDYLTRRLKRIYRGNGDEAIELMSGQRVIFKARTKGGGRGLSGDKVVLDEGFALQPVHMGALLPTLSARPDPQIVVGSSAGLADSEVLRGMRDRGRSGQSSRQAYIEFCAPRDGCAERDCDHTLQRQGCALDDVENWRRANPALGRRITEETIAAERQTLPPGEFARERLGWWDDPGVIEPAFGPGAWEACGVEYDPDSLPTEGIAVGLAVSLDRAWASFGSAAPQGDNKVFVGAVDRRRGTAWVVAEAKRLQDTHHCPIVVDGKGPGSTLIPDLEEAGVKVTIASTSDVCDACAWLYDAVQQRQVEHMGFDELDAAVAGAQKRDVGDRWAWGRKTSVCDVSMLEAATLAAWGIDGSNYDLLDSVW